MGLHKGPCLGYGCVPNIIGAYSISGLKFDYVMFRFALPVYLILPTGPYRGQSINLIKEDYRRPHQVSLKNTHMGSNHSAHSKKTLKLACSTNSLW